MAFTGLPPRLLAVLTRLCAGQDEDEIAMELGLLPASVRRYRDIVRHRWRIRTLEELCRRLTVEDAAAAAPTARRARSRDAAEQFPDYRVEHRAADGTVRLLASSRVQTLAIASAATWAQLLRRQASTGTVVVVDAAAGVTIFDMTIADG